MTHYVCTGGCGGESSAAGVCQMEDCKNEGEPLVVCSCEDGAHKEAQSQKDENAIGDE